MKYRLQSVHFAVLILFAISTTFLLFSSVGANGQPQVHTIQAGSYSQEPAAVKAYYSLAETLAPGQRDHLRLEKVGGYYTVRLGRFGSWTEANRFLGEAGKLPAGAFVMQAYIKPERISLLYEPISYGETSKPSLQGTASARKGSAVDIEPVIPEKETPAVTFATSLNEQREFYTIQVGSYGNEDAAEKRYQSLASVLETKQRDHLRIEKVQRYFTVRLGKFMTRAEAASFLGAVGKPLGGADILQAFIRVERISRQYQPEGEAIASALPAGEQQDDIVQPLSGAQEAAANELDGSFETVEKDVQAGGAIVEGEAQPEMIDETAAAAVVVPQLETAAEQDLKDYGERTPDPENDIFNQGEKFVQRGQPSGLFPVRVVKVFSNDIYGSKISFPREVHYDPFMDEIYLLSTGGQVNTRVTIYGQDYFPVAALGPGRGVSNPMGVTVDKLGNIYVALGESRDDSSRVIPPMIRVLNAAFFKMYDISLNEIPGIPSGFVPQNIALGSDNETLYISGRGAKGVLVLDLEGNFKRWLMPMKVGGVSEEIGNDHSHPGALKVEDVVVDSKGRIFILADIAGRVFVLDREENFLFAFGELGGSTGKLSNPRSIAVDVNREAIYIVDYMRHAINVYAYKDGKYLLEFGGQGLAVGWFQFPAHIAVDRRGNVIVADMFNHRVQIMEVP